MGTLRQPKFEFTFTQKAKSFKERSKNNIIIFVTEPKQSKDLILELEDIEDVVKNKLSFEDNYKLVEDCFHFEPSPSLVTVYVVKEEPTDISLLLDDIKNTREIAYVIYPTAAETTQKALCNWIKAQAKTNKSFKTIVIGEEDADAMEIVNLDKTQEIEFLDSTRTEKEFKYYIPSLASVLAGSGAIRGTTYTQLSNLKRVKQPNDVNESINKGHLVLINDEGVVRIALGINSKTTLQDDESDELKFLETMETINLLKRDASNIFKIKYVSNGKKNDPDMQQLYITDVNTYFKGLEQEQILDRHFSNYAEIDVEAQRQALIAKGITEAKKWDDTKVKNTVVDKDVFVKAKIKIAESVINLKFNTTMM